VKTPRIKDLMEMVLKQIHEDTPQPRGVLGPSILQISDSTFS